MAAIVIDTAADLLRLYLDGVEVGAAPLGGANAGSISDTLVYLGRSLFNVDPAFTGSINELRIYDNVLDAATIAKFQRELAAMGYTFQFVTLAGFHALNLSMFELARAYRDEGMTAYARLQDREFELQKTDGFAAVKHQSFVGTGYFDAVAKAISSGQTSTAALEGSTEEKQF